MLNRVLLGPAIIVQLALTVGLTVFCPETVFCQESDLQSGVSMTLFPLLTGTNGQQYYLNQNHQALALPGAGVGGQDVSIYQGVYGGHWYVDKNGQPVELPPEQAPSSGFAPPAAGAPYYGQAQIPYYGGQGYGPAPYTNTPYPQQTMYQPAPATNVQVTNELSANSSDNSSTSGTTSGTVAGMAMGTLAGAALGMAMGGIPYGVPLYYGVGGVPYYMGATGERTFINNVNNPHFNEWQNQHNWYQKQVNNFHGGEFRHWWPGREHGFPAPDDRSGRMYATGQADSQARQAGEVRGGERRDGLFRNEHGLGREGGMFMRGGRRR